MRGYFESTSHFTPPKFYYTQADTDFDIVNIAELNSNSINNNNNIHINTKHCEKTQRLFRDAIINQSLACRQIMFAVCCTLRVCV